MKRKLILMAVCASFMFGVTAAKPVKAPAGGKKISNELIGIFFEDISMSADGGLCAELIQNGSFEFSPSERDGWGPGTAWRSIRPGHSLGYIEPKQQDPIHPNNPNYMRLNIERVGHYYDYNGWTGVGIQNDGYDGILLKGGDKYDFSVFLRNPDGKDKEVRAVLLVQGRGFRAQPTVIADTTFTVSGSDWKKYEYTLTAAQDCPNASLQLLSLTTGVMDIDMVSLYPQDTYKGHGLRKDLAQALVDLNPKFMRFPGGCVVHGGGDGFWDTYRWKTTVGPKETRKGIKNTWGYHQSMEMGYFEYFQFCEDAGMEPLPILPCGVSCQGTNGGWNMRTQAQDAVPMEDMQEWADEALDLIEWANGPADSKWGKVRADAGHPEPFNLKYLGLGNEEKITPEFEERFKFIYDQVRAKYPDIVIVGTAGPGSHPGNGDYEEGWKFATELEVPILDEHYYEQRNYFLTSRQYDSYPRDRKTKVYLGEYAAKDKKLIDALAEGLYLLHVERNADVVVMTSYAPLFARKNTNNWNPDLIYFDNERPFLTCSYYVQQMFGQSSGDYFYGECVKFDREDDNLLGQSVVLDTQARKLYLKVCNAGENAAKATIDLSRFGGFKSVTKTVIKGQPDDENNFDQQPIAPVTESIKLKSKATLDVEPYSITLYTISL
ncbi:MAG: alpha-N-arabinofuranosidase [Bacteroidaceae bacterium]|nr:alpha-N-arabinofuranosidase [Bacteroidaceae bacterium]MBR6856732.1 alpha-N-arabinofuranosidase [Bacteroidaceae bacterium]